MRSFCTILMLFVYSTTLAAKQDTAGLHKAVYDLNSALLQKDSIALRRLLHPKIEYGHSNGWIETKREVIDDLYSGKLNYNKIEQGAIEVVKEGNIACVRSVIDVEIMLNGQQIKLKLHVLQVWLKEKTEWILLSRQSTKI